MPWLTVLEYAEECGVSKQGAYDRINAGRVTSRVIDGQKHCWMGEGEPTDEDLETYSEARARKTRAEADMHEMKAAERSGELLPVEDVARAWADLAGVVVAQLDALPARLAPLVASIEDPQACRTLIEDEIRALRGRIAEATPGYRETT